MSSLDVRAIDETSLRKEARPKSKHELTVYLAEAAFDRAVERGGADTTREIGGVLVGEILRDDSGPYLRIETTIDAVHADEKGAELTFTHATWDHINKEMDSKHQGKKVVGWYHTHPGFGVFLSDRDQFIHKSFFNLPFQVALVYDPKSKEHGVFSWRDNEVWRLRRYAIGSREHTWDGNRAAARPEIDTAKAGKAAARGEGDRERGRSSERHDDRDRDDDGWGGSILPYAMTGLLLMLIAGFVGHWIGASAGNAAMVQSQVDLVKAQEIGGQLERARLQHDLVDVLRANLSDEAVRQPALRAIAELEVAISTLAGGAAVTATPGDPRLASAVTQLRAIREDFARVAISRASAEQTLTEIEMMTRQGNENRVDMARELAAQRAGIGRLFLEMATDAEKANDKRRAASLLQTANAIDPGNHAIYQERLDRLPGDRLLQPFTPAPMLPPIVPGAAVVPPLVGPPLKTPATVPPPGAAPLVVPAPKNPAVAPAPKPPATVPPPSRSTGTGGTP